MNPPVDLSPAYIAFVGVVVGAVMTGLKDYVLTRMKQQQDRHAEESTELQARRLIHFELCEAQHLIGLCLQYQKWMPDPYNVRVIAWNTYSPVLAGKLAKEDWQILIVAYADLYLLSVVDKNTDFMPNNLKQLLPKVDAAVRYLQE